MAEQEKAVNRVIIQANQRETLWVFGSKPFGLLDINKKQAGNVHQRQMFVSVFGSLNHGSLNREIEDIAGS